jgi:hypothetical protein
LSLTLRSRPTETRRQRKKDEPEAPPSLGMKVKASGAINVYDTIAIVFDEPVKELNKEWFTLEQKIDTLWTPAAFVLFPDSNNALAWYILHEWRYGESYRMMVDSAVIYSLYGKANLAKSQSFTIKAEDQYGQLYMNVEKNDTLPAFLDLLDGNDHVVRKAKVKDGGVLLMNLDPGKYYARLVVDENDNFIWDTGNYAAKRQPETVCYYPKVIEIMKNWEIEATWDVSSVTAIRQKPLEITKNKPKEATKIKRDYKNEGRSKSSGNANPMGRSMSF